MTITKTIVDFLEYMEIERGRAIASVKNYDHYLQVFAGFAKVQGIDDPTKINQDLVRQFRLDLNRKSLIGKNTQNYYLIAIRSYLKYLARNSIQTLDANQIELAKSSERQITFLTEEELENLLNQPDSSTIQGVRDKAILNLLFSTGLRVSEASNLKKDQINLEKKEFSIKGKGGKIRVVFMDAPSKDAIKKYLTVRTDDSEYLFLSYGHTNKQTAHSIQTTDNRPQTTDRNRSPKSVVRSLPITPRSIQRMIHKYALQAGITKEVTPHTMRHSFATDLLMNGADLRAVQSLLGHSSVTTTQIYTHVTDQHLQDVHEAFHGRKRPESEAKTDELEKASE